MGQLLDFGNGVIAGGSSGDEVRIIDHSGLYAPEVEIASTENAVLDGGVLGASRAKMRRATVVLDFSKSPLSRAQVAAKFTPGVSRILTSARGTLEYYVEIPPSWASSNEHASARCSVTILSPAAYPVAPLQTLTGADAGWQYTNVENTVGSLKLAPYHTGTKIRLWQSFTVASDGSTIAAPYFRLTSPSAQTAQWWIVNTSAGLPNMASIIASGSLSLPSGASSTTFPGGPWEVDDGVYALVIDGDNIGGSRDTAAGFAGGVGGYYNGSAYVAGDGTDATVDWKFGVVVGAPAAETTLIYFDSTSEVPAPLVVTATLGSSASALVISDGEHTTTITGTLLDGDIVVIDSEAHTVTVNGTNRLSWFERSGAWPMVYPGATSLSVSPSSAITATWRPRLMGML